MGELITGYFTEAQIQDRRGYISRNKIATALEGLELYYAQYAEGIRRPETPAMLEGRKLHMMTLEREKFRKNRLVHRFANLRSTEAQEWLKRVRIEHPNAEILSREESLGYDRVVDRVLSHKLAGGLISNSLKEGHGYAVCPRTGMQLYSRPDIITAEGEVGELKFVKNVDAFAFGRQQYSERWFMQLAFYSAVHGLITGTRTYGNCFYVAVESSYPHRVRVYPLPVEFEKMGDILWNEGLDKIVDCLKLDPQMKNYEVWRRESNRAQTLEVEMWMMNNDERFRGLIGLGA